MIYNGSSYNENWKISKLAELGTFARGVSKHRPRNDPKLFENGKYPLVQTGDVKEATLYLSKHELEYRNIVYYYCRQYCGNSNFGLSNVFSR